MSPLAIAEWIEIHSSCNNLIGYKVSASDSGVD